MIIKYMQKARLVANLVLCVVINCNSMSLNRKEFLLTVIVNHEAVVAGEHVPYLRNRAGKRWMEFVDLHLFFSNRCAGPCCRIPVRLV